MRVRRIGVIGAGVIGKSVAQDFAQTGHEVLLIDVADEILEHAKREIARNVRFHHMVAESAEPQDVTEVLDRIRFSADYAILTDAEFVIENTTEDWDIKREVFRRLDAVCEQECVFASNTSAIPITKLASVTDRASQVLGMHFMNPVPLKPVVEVIRGYHTSDATVEVAKTLLSQTNKQAIVVRDSPGFVSNRVLMLTINEAIFLVQENVASAKDIDEIFKRCFGHKMGPLETADLIGLDTILRTLEVLHESFRDSKYRPCPLLQSLVHAGLLGRKSGRGFHEYGVGGRRSKETGGGGDSDGDG